MFLFNFIYKKNQRKKEKYITKISPEENRKICNLSLHSINIITFAERGLHKAIISSKLFCKKS